MSTLSRRLLPDIKASIRMKPLSTLLWGFRFYAQAAGGVFTAHVRQMNRPCVTIGRNAKSPAAQRGIGVAIKLLLRV